MIVLLRNQSDAARLGELVDRGRRKPRVDRPAHQRHGARQVGVAVLREQRHAGEHRHGRLAHRHHVRRRAEVVIDLDQVVDVVVEIEGAVRDRHHARVGPVGDEDLVLRQHRLDGAAQKRRVVAGERRDDQKLRIGRAALRQIAAEVDRASRTASPRRPPPGPPPSCRRSRSPSVRIPACRSAAWCARRARPRRRRSARRACRRTD